MDGPPAPRRRDTPADSLLTVAEVAVKLNVSEQTVYRMARAHGIPAVRIGRSWRFDPRRIDALLTV